MKTEVILKRKLYTGMVRQKSKSGMFNASDLAKIANEKRKEIGRSIFNLSAFLKQKGTIEFIEELQNTYPEDKILRVSKGRNGGTWVHPLLFIDIALAIDPKFKVSVYEWMFDELLKHRNNSGESYKKMIGSLYDRYENKGEFNKYVVKVANYIKKSCKVDDWNKATQEQLNLRDKMHNNISLLCNVTRNTDLSVREGVKQSLNESNF